MIEFLHRPALAREAAPVRVRRWPLADGGTLLRVSETELDPSGVMTVDYEVLELDEDGTYDRWTERQRNRSFEQEEMRALLGSAGLEAEPFLPAYDHELAVEVAVHLLAVARRA